MPVFMLSDEFIFPPADFARHDGLLCVGGDLSYHRLIKAYKSGIFPWFSKGEPILWWSPDPRLVLFPSNIRISRSLGKKIKKGTFSVTMDTAFEDVIRECATSRIEAGIDTWLVDGMIEAYVDLYNRGDAHSVETWQKGRLVGGLYGVSIGRIFFGESMFSRESDASKIALAALCFHLQKYKFDLIDCQVTTPHLVSMGAEEIPRQEFLLQLNSSVKKKGLSGRWIY
ncbi:leucyl/phenylalanyl-tRNA-protein transferase [Desulfamplus magnetovallimortis]|uniref:Leucyl/phenylalanyl-tRNA--protein transferase n=2 Tax=Desulfamplus magnetovallimortis TaxID=1246637 RepID=A0A1W1H9G2_9BACT|nr:leucyl/phenylalanyl-tRNA--protein transferase [Desulfamplus magnetovallimortis]SLM29130.1 leucyl/phenylalanyl-tRNA-protein transferase [Desulfamplus magnetovallimortis]